MDVVELGEGRYQTGQVAEVKVLGSLCLIDQGEIDWKVFTMEREEAERRDIRSLEDIDRLSPGRLQAIQQWFINIKTFEDGHRPPDQVVPSML